MEGDNAMFRYIYAHKHFNPLPPHGGRRKAVMFIITDIIISIHSLRMEGDPVPVSYPL